MSKKGRFHFSARKTLGKISVSLLVLIFGFSSTWAYADPVTDDGGDISAEEQQVTTVEEIEVNSELPDETLPVILPVADESAEPSDEATTDSDAESDFAITSLEEPEAELETEPGIIPLDVGPQILGGDQASGDLLEITITSTGGVDPRRWYPRVGASGYEWQRTYYNQGDGSGLSLWNGTTRLMQGGYFSASVSQNEFGVPQNCIISVGAKIVGADQSETITRTWTGTGVAAGIVIFETFRLDKGSTFYTRTVEIRNNSSAALDNCRLYIGGDTYFRGSDLTYGNINLANNAVYVYRGMNDGIMTLRGADNSTPSFYFSANYLVGRNLVLNGQDLTGDTYPHTTNANEIDTGYYLQWGSATAGMVIPVGGTRSLTMTETFSDPGALQVISPGGRTAPPGALVSYNFTLTNVLLDDLTGLSISLSAESQHELQGWVATVDPTTLTLLGGGSVNVTVSVRIPDTAVDGMTDQLTLTANYTGTYQSSPVSGTATGMTVTTVDRSTPYISDVVITYLDDTQLDTRIFFQNFTGATPTTVSIYDEFGVYTGITQTLTISSGGDINGFDVSSLTPGAKYYLYVSAVGIPYPHNTTFFVMGTPINPRIIVNVQFDANGGVAASPASKTVTVGMPYGALATTSRTGYIFNGWFTADVGGSLIDDTSTVTINLPHTLYAHWTAIEYTVRYLPGAHGTFAIQETTGLHYGDPTPASPLTTGERSWVFNGWSPARTADVTGDATYVAQWLYKPDVVTPKTGDAATLLVGLATITALLGVAAITITERKKGALGL